MKKIFFLILLALSLSSDAQQIRSIHLDSLIWNEINSYRKSLGILPVKKFNNGELRLVSYKLTNLNADRPISEFDHNRGDSTFKGYNDECIFSHLHSYSNSSKFSSELTEENLQELAKLVVKAWIDSPNHNYLIASKLVDQSTVTSVLVLSPNSLRIVVSYHDLIKI